MLEFRTNTVGRLTDQETRNGSGVAVADYAYQYDLNNRLTQKIEYSVSTT